MSLKGALVRWSARRLHAEFPAAELRKCWIAAQDLWEARVDLSPPVAFGSGPVPTGANANEPLAYIDLETRQVVVNLRLLGLRKLHGSLTAVLAHEVGHHVRYPHTLGLLAHLQVLERRFIPMLASSLTNLFFDLQVNEFVGRTLVEPLMEIYRVFRREEAPKLPDPVFEFYLAIYEELWGQPPGSLTAPGAIRAMEDAYPGWRSDARIFAQTFFALPDDYLQFVYFCSRFLRYLPEPDRFAYSIPMGSDLPPPDAEDCADALVGNPSVERALDEAERRGWIVPEDVARTLAEPDDFGLMERMSGGHGRGAVEFRRSLVDRYYRRHIERYLFAPPRVGAGPTPDPLVPTTVSEWEFGDDPARIDWSESILRAGPLAGAMPVQRDLEPDDPEPPGRAFPSVEIYLDTSGSMPDPVLGLNALTLAAQVLSASVLRKKGRVRGVVYSDGRPLVSEWMQDEDFARRFLFHYSGGGTSFPFGVLQRLAEADTDVVRVVVSDLGFAYDLERAVGPDTMRFALDHSRLVVVLLGGLLQTGRGILALRSLTAHPGLRVVHAPVDKLGETAGRLARALFGERP